MKLDRTPLSVSQARNLLVLLFLGAGFALAGAVWVAPLIRIS